MSRTYEALIVVDTKGKDQSIQEFQNSIGKEMEAEGATLKESDTLGRKTFAYNARKLDGAHYLTYTFTADPSVISPIKAKLGLNADIYMQYYQLLG